MAYVVTEPCFGCKYTDCVVVCPCDCFHEGEEMLFIDPEERQLDMAKHLGAPVVELHTGAYCDASGGAREGELQRIVAAAAHAEAIGLECHAGHGLSYDSVGPVAAIATIVELNIGHFLVGEAIFSGLESAIKRMRALMDKVRAERQGQKSA